MADFGTGRDKKSHDYDVGKKAKDHAVRLSGAFRRVNDNYACARSPIIDLEFCQFTETSSREESRRVISKTINISLSKIGLRCGRRRVWRIGLDYRARVAQNSASLVTICVSPP